MKKQLLALAMLGFGITNAQTWSQNFSSATVPNLPANWSQNNVDGNTVVSNLSSYNFGSNAWVTRSFTTSLSPYGNIAISTSWYTPAGVSNDWLISPSFTVPPGAVINWEAMAGDASFPDGYQVRISTTGTSVASFTANPALFSINAENATFTQRGASLNTYSNQTVHVAFRNNSNDMFLLLVDNINVSIPPASDGNVMSITGLTRWRAGAGTQNIGGVFRNLGGNTVSNAVLNYNVNNGPVTTQTINFANIGYYQTANYAFTTPANLAVGENRIKVWVTSVNGTPETILANDTARAVVYVTSQGVTRNGIFEEWTSSTCNPCASLNSTFDPLLASNSPNTNGRFNVIKYQVNWPAPGNDPSYNNDSRARVLHYGINAAPSIRSNGASISSGSANSQAGIDASKTPSALATINASLSVTGSNIVGNATITPYITLGTSNSPLRVHQVLLQKFYNYPGATTTQKNYYHVMRKMFPNGWGASVSTTDNTPFTVNFNHTANVVGTPAQNSFDFWSTTNLEFEYVVFVQDSIGNEILNSASAINNINVGVVEFSKESQIGVYPNPAKDFAVVGIKLNNPSKVDIQIMDVTGKVVYNNNSAEVVNPGQNEIKINTTEFPTGTYNILVKTAEGTFKEKLIISK